MEIAIFGSCVSRDAFTFSPRGTLNVGAYLARSSLASAFFPEPVLEDWLQNLSKIESPFQRRMVECDMRKHAGRLLECSTADVVLLDLIDERFNVVSLGGSLATWSSEFSKLELAKESFGPVFRPGDIRRAELWHEGARRLVDLVGADRLILNEVYWAELLADGQELPRQESIRAANALLANMYSSIRSFGVHRCISYPQEYLRADPDHKWGVSPFHFVPQFYNATIERLETLTGVHDV